MPTKADVSSFVHSGASKLAAAQNSLWQLRYGFPQFMVLTGEDQQAIVDAEAGLVAEVEANMAAYGKLPHGAKTRALMNTWNETWPKYMNARPKWFELQGAGPARGRPPSGVPRRRRRSARQP